ncbi:hypothetical protein HBB16_13945 [Pseudonocardia sp. MCCB 268]|nr:hypothetical protein [Pseudonocardia cytotoxica]
MLSTARSSAQLGRNSPGSVAAKAARRLAAAARQFRNCVVASFSSPAFFASGLRSAQLDRWLQPVLHAESRRRSSGESSWAGQRRPRRWSSARH